MLEISLFGHLRIVSTQDSREIQLPHSVQALLAYLLIKRGRVISRDHLADLFWGELDEQHAHNCLNTALWRLRRIFRQSGARLGKAGFLAADRAGEIRLDHITDCRLDIIEFSRLWEQIPKQACDLTERNQSSLNRIVELYKGDLLEGLDDEWILPEREHYRQIYLSSLVRSMDYYRGRNMPEKSVEYGQRILSVDPLREDIHRELMQRYSELGQRSLAIHQYKICHRTLAKDLNIAPMLETQMLYEAILSESDPHQATQNQPKASRADTNEERRNILAYVKNAITRVEQVQHDLNQAKEMLEHYSDMQL